MVKEEHKKVKLGPKKITVPSGWKIKDMKDLIKFKNGYAFSSKNYSENGKIVFRMSNINRKGNLNVNEENIKYCSEETYDELERYHLAKDDLVICMTDMNSDLNILGRTGIIDKDDEYILNQRVGRMRVKNEDIVNFKYLHYFTNFKPYLDYIKATATGTAQYNTSTKTIKNTNVVLPSLPEQKKIASILSSVDKSIEKTDEVIEETKKVKKGLMRELLTKGIGNSKFKEVRIGTKKTKIPQRWNILNLEELVDLRNGKFNPTKNLSDDFDIPVYGGNGITGYYNEPLIEEPTIVIGRVGEYCGSIHLVKEKTWVTDNAIYINEINDKNNIYLDYLALYLKFANLNNLSNRTGQPKLTQSRILTVGIPVPPLKEQNKIASILSSVDAKIQKEEEYKAKLERLKNGLMQKLLTGEIRVNTDMEV